MQEQEDSWSMDSKKRIVFYEEWYEVIDGLPQKEKLEAYEAVFRYALYGIVPENKVINAITALMRVQVDRDKEKWEETQKKRSIAGKIGGINSGASRRKKTEANASQTKQTEANKGINIDINRDININSDININNNDDVVIAEKISTKKKSPYQGEMVDANRLAEWLRATSQSWKEVACMQLRISLDELDRAFNDYQNEVQAQGKTEEEERQIKPHFMNLIRIKLKELRNGNKGNTNRIADLSDIQQAVQAGRRMAEQN